MAIVCEARSFTCVPSRSTSMAATLSPLVWIKSDSCDHEVTGWLLKLTTTSPGRSPAARAGETWSLSWHAVRLASWGITQSETTETAGRPVGSTECTP